MIIITCGRLIEIRGDNIFENCQLIDWNGAIIPDSEKRDAIKLFVNTFAGFPRRTMLTNEYAWPLRPEQPRATRVQRNTRVMERAADSECSRKRDAPWCASHPGIIKKRVEMQQRADQTAAQEARGVRERSASCDSKHADFMRTYISMLDDECTVAAKNIGMYSYILSVILKLFLLCLHYSYVECVCIT